MRKAMVVVGILAVLAGASANAALIYDWGYAGDLNTTGNGTFDNGWLIQMYRDVNANGLSDVTFNPDGSTGGGTGSDDLLLSGFSTTVVKSTKGAQPSTWSLSAQPGDTIAGFDVYTVIFNAASIGGAGQAIIVDSSPFSMPSDGYAVYVQQSVGEGGWQAVPEPTTLALLGIGAAVLGLRKAVRRA